MPDDYGRLANPVLLLFKKMNFQTKSALYAVLAYVMWGFLPIYWKWLGHVSSEEILAHRILWSFLFSLMLLFVMGKSRQIKETIVFLRSRRKQLALIFSASVIISINWFLYIWAVNNDRVTEASLGYYINPLVSVLLGMIFLKEKLNWLQTVSFLSAGAGVIILTFLYGSFPWVSVGLAVSFGLYGLIKKIVQLDSLAGLAVETSFLFPFSLAYLLFLQQKGNFVFLADSLKTSALLIGAGIATLLPLLLFVMGAKGIPLFLLGILQYIAPTVMFILGVFVYNEIFTPMQFAGFLCIWFALILFTFSSNSRITIKQKGKKEMEV